MKIWAGAWLNCVVLIERTIAISSAIPWVCGRRSEIAAADRPHFLNAYGEPRSLGVPLMKAKRSPFTNSSGMAWPSYWRSFGFSSKRSTWDGAPAMNR